MKNKIDQVLKFIKQNDNFLITTHVNSDGDALASVIACSLFLEKLDKKYAIILEDQKIDKKYNYLKNWDKIQSLNDSIKEKYFDFIQSVLVFDAPGNKRIGAVAEMIPAGAPVAKIDHHPSEENYGDFDWVDTTASSAASLLYEIIKTSPVKIDREIGEALYTGIIYDTGRLSFSNTRARDFEICSNLLAIGVQPNKITNKLFFNNDARALRIIGKGLVNLQQFGNDRISVITLMNNELNGVDQNDVEELANYSVSLRDSEVGIFIREIEPHFFKISLRSKEYVDVSRVAAQFDGGGHVRASGCRFKGEYKELLKSIVSVIEEQL